MRVNGHDRGVLAEAAIILVQRGVGVLPIVLPSKRPAAIVGRWGYLQTRLPKIPAVIAWFDDAGTDGIALICGAISGGLEILDFDANAEAVYTAWCDLVERYVPGLLARLPREQSLRGGYHLAWRCAEVSGNTILARRGADQTLIETRGEGGYCAVAPTPGYTQLTDLHLADAPEITPNERLTLLACARALNEYALPEQVERDPSPKPKPGELRPGDDYNQRHGTDDVVDLLVSHGWQATRRLGSRHGGAVQLTRPGKDVRLGISATVGYCGPGWLYNFSSNAAPFQTGRCYRPFGVYTELEHGGDYAAAAGALRRRGYGSVGPAPARLIINGRTEEPAPGADDVTDDDAPPCAEPYVRPAINASQKDLTIIRPEAISALVDSNDPPRLFMHAGEPVRIETDERNERPILKPLTTERLRHELANAIDFQTFEQRRGEGVWKPALPPVWLVEDILATPALPLPPVTRVVEAPIFGRDQALHGEPGYCPETETYLVLPPELDVVPVAPTPSHAEVAEAKRFIVDELLGEFGFVGDADRAHAVAGLLLLFVRELIDGPTPLHMVEAPEPGTGKGLLVSCLTMPAVGHGVALVTQAKDEDEWRKRITAQLRAGHSAILIDNLTRTLNSGTLAAALTAVFWEDRLLGKNEMLRFRVRSAWFATANNPAMSLEIARRSVRIRLDAKKDQPWLRDDVVYRHDPLATWAWEQRSALIWSACTLVQSWIAGGAKPFSGKPLGSYEQWSAVVGGILEHAGIGGFLGNLKEFYKTADTEGTMLREFVTLWWEKFQDQPTKANDLLHLAAQSGMDLGKGNDRAQRTRFGMKLGQQRDRVIGDYQVTYYGEVDRVAAWKLVKFG
jgi:hypothetical protein